MLNRPVDSVVHRNDRRSLVIAVIEWQIDRAVGRDFYVAVQTAAMRIGHRIYFDGWAKTRPAVIASGAGCGWNLRTVVDRVGIKSRNVCRPSQRRVEWATADRFVVDARAQAAALRWYPGLAVVISKGGLTRGRSQR